MPVVEERLSLLEVKMEEVGTTLLRIEGVLGSLHHMVLGLDQRVDKLDQRIDRLEHRLDTLDHRVDKLDTRVEKQFLWVVGIQITTLVTIMAGLFGLVAKLI